MSLFDVSLVFFLIMDPVGNLNAFLSLVQGLDKKRKVKIVFRELLIALVIMLGFNFLGDFIFQFLNLSEVAVRIASGIVLLLVAIKIIFGSKDSLRARLPQGEPFIFPLAVPLIAGPALLATIMLYARLEPVASITFAAVLIAWSLSVIIFLLAEPISKFLKSSGLIACEKLIGMVLVMIAVQALLEGVMLFWKVYGAHA